MKKVHFQIEIDCPRDKVFSIMLDESYYREWTEVFAPTSHYEGSWEEGSKIYFLVDKENGKKHGMLSFIEKVIPNEFVSIKHLAMLNEGKETPFENGDIYEKYYFEAKGNSTLLKIEMDSEDDWIEYFDKTWPKALQKLKHVCEDNC